MSMRRVISLAAVAALGIACVSADAFAARVAARGGAVGVRGGAVGVRGGAIGVRGGAVAYRGGLGYRGGLYGGGYYRPGLGLAAGAVVGGAIVNPNGAGTEGVTTSAYCAYGNGYGCGYGSGYGYNPGYSYAAPTQTSPIKTTQPIASTNAYAGGCTSDPIMCNGQCWLYDNQTNYHWGDCPAVHVRAH
jgi:hypothetical protein